MLLKSQYRGTNCRFSTLIRTVFGSLGEVTGADNDFGLRTLLALVGAGPAERIILPSAVTAQEETPLHPPFFAAAHKSSCSGTSRPGCFPSGDFCLEHSFFAASSRSRILPLVLDDPCRRRLSRLLPHLCWKGFPKMTRLSSM